MILSDINFDIWYDEYKEQRRKSIKYVKSRKGKTRGLEQLSRRDFETDFRAYLFDNPNLSGVQIAKRMAKEEVYAVSSKQAERLAEAHVEHLGGKLTMDLVNKYRVQAMTSGGLFDSINLRREILHKEHPTWSTYRINEEVSQEFFGS